MRVVGLVPEGRVPLWRVHRGFEPILRAMMHDEHEPYTIIRIVKTPNMPHAATVYYKTFTKKGVRSLWVRASNNRETPLDELDICAKVMPWLAKQKRNAEKRLKKGGKHERLVQNLDRPED